MITTIKASNVDAFNLLFEEATNILSGYKEVRTYSAYFKNDADIMRQINMIYQMCVYDYGIIICQAIGDNSL